MSFTVRVDLVWNKRKITIKNRQLFFYFSIVFVLLSGTGWAHWLFIHHRPLSFLLLGLFQPVWYSELYPPLCSDLLKAGIWKTLLLVFVWPTVQNGCLHFKIVGKESKDESSFPTWKLYEIKIFGVHTVLLEQCHMYLFMHYLWQPPNYTGWLRSCKWNHLALKAWNIYCLVL